MAIYTQFGRYEKARSFKHWADTEGDVYMLLCFGNPKWDNTDDASTQEHNIPVAPYNTSIISYTDSNMPSGTDPLTYNQFYDVKVNMSFIDSSAVSSALTDGVPNTSSDSGKYIDKCKNLIPPFPCWWKVGSTNNTIEFTNGSSQVSVDLNNYDKYYITESSDIYTLHKIGDSDTTIDFPTGDTDIDATNRKYFSELYLRGLAIENGIYQPVGLLGAVRCNVDLVRDIGNDDSVYTGELNQFWYGDRYWEVVNINEGNEIDGYIDDANGKSILPCHLAFTATIPPMFLCGDMKFDQNLSPRQIAIFTRNRELKKIGGIDKLVRGPSYYRVDENIFNFGQYYKVSGTDVWSPTVPSAFENKILNFALPCTIGSNVYPVDHNNSGVDFKFLLGDYLRGSKKTMHSAERIGYVVGF